MIRFLLLQNRAGKTRLAKYYVPVSDHEKRKLEYDVHRLIVVRDPKHTNIVEVRAQRRVLHRVVVCCQGVFGCQRPQISCNNAGSGLPACQSSCWC